MWQGWNHSFLIKNVQIHYCNLQQLEHKLPPPLLALRFDTVVHPILVTYALAVSVHHKRFYPEHHQRFHPDFYSTAVNSCYRCLMDHGDHNCWLTLISPSHTIFSIPPGPCLSPIQFEYFALTTLGSWCWLLFSVPVYSVSLLSNSSTKGTLG